MEKVDKVEKVEENMKMTNKIRGRPRIVTAAQLSAILEMAQAGKNYLQIAKAIGVNKGSVRYFMQKYAQNGVVNNGE